MYIVHLFEAGITLIGSHALGHFLSINKPIGPCPSLVTCGVTCVKWIQLDNCSGKKIFTSLTSNWSLEYTSGSLIQLED